MAQRYKKSRHVDGIPDIFLVVFQNLSWAQADVLADVVQLAELSNRGVVLAGNGLQGIALLNLVEVYIR